jgi:large subunit ribosomal protein L25
MPEVVTAKPRTGKFNKNAARRVRAAGQIPAVLYGAGHDAVAVELDPKHISKILYSDTGHNTIFDVDLGDKSPVKAMIVDWQREPIKDRLIHIDLKRIAMDKVLKVNVRVKLLGVPIGVKTHGGVLDQVMREVEIECLPTDIPSHIDVDVSNLDLHEVLRVSGLPHSDKIKFLDDEEATVAHVITIREEAVATPDAAAEAAATAGTTAEPEVAKKGKTEGEGEAGKKPEGAKK